jgi:enamine deaminase RidA (YjgF/YER057c/UK114 family)
VPDGFDEQAATVWANLASILRAGAMTLTDVVSLTTYVVAGEDLGVVMRARDVALAGHRPASTLVTVPALAQAAWKLEISAVAAVAAR